MNSFMKAQFWGTSFEVTPIGLTHISLNKHKEKYVITRPTSTAQNLVFGNIYVEHSGKSVCEKIVQNDQIV